MNTIEDTQELFAVNDNNNDKNIVLKHIQLSIKWSHLQTMKSRDRVWRLWNWKTE